MVSAILTSATSAASDTSTTRTIVNATLRVIGRLWGEGGGGKLDEELEAKSVTKFQAQLVAKLEAKTANRRRQSETEARQKRDKGGTHTR